MFHAEDIFLFKYPLLSQLSSYKTFKITKNTKLASCCTVSHLSREGKEVKHCRY